MVKQTDSGQQPQAALSVPQLAFALGISLRLAWKLIYERKVAYFKLGRRTLVPYSEIDLLISRNTVPATDAKPSEVARQLIADSANRNGPLRSKGATKRNPKRPGPISQVQH